MPRRARFLLQLGCALGAALVLGACTKGGQFDPTTLLESDMLDTKTKLKGQREPLFPNGVPGATTGVPPELMKGYQPPPEQSADTSNAAAPDSSNAGGRAAAPAAHASAAAAEEPAAKPKPKPKPKIARAPAVQDPAFSRPPASASTRISVGPARSNAPAPQGGASPQSVWGDAPQAARPGPTASPDPRQSAPVQQTQQTTQPAQAPWPNSPAPASPQ